MTGCLRHVTYDSYCDDCRRKRDSDALSDTLLYGMPVSGYDVPSDVASDPSPVTDTTPSFDAFDGGSSGGGGATGGWE